MRNALKKEPVGLQQMFESTLQRIDGQSKARSSLARRLISWILYAKRRLSIEEVLTAFAINEEGLDYDNMPSLDILLRVCVGLVVLNQVDRTLGLVHTSAYDYLYTLLPPGMSHFDIAQTCLKYLGLKGLISEPCKSSTELMTRFDELKFLDYSAKHWGHHICDQAMEERLQPLITQLLCDDSLLNSAFQALQFPRKFEGSLSDDIFDSLPKGHHALHVAAYWNLVGTVGTILKAGADVSATDSHKWSPLHWACSNNHLRVAILLVEKGASVNLPDIQGWTPLFWGAFRGDVEIVRLLLRTGANHQCRSSLGWTALHWAISGGHFSVVKELLDHHSRSMKTTPKVYKMKMAQIKAYSQDTAFPIELAAETQDPDLFSLLVRDLELRNGRPGDEKFNCVWRNAKFDRPVSRNPWRTMVKGERMNGIERTVPKSDSSSRSHSEYYWKSVLLASAIRDEQLASTQMLAKTGADSNRFCVLHMAAHRRDPRYVQCLLESGADAHIGDMRGRSALHIAIMNGFVETVSALISGGSDVNQSMSDSGLERERPGSPGVKNIPPLILAEGDLQMVRVLLENGADVKQSNTSGQTALHCAFLRGDFPVMKLLIEFSASTDIIGPNGETPLHYLTICDDPGLGTEKLKEMVLFLISIGKILSPPRDFLIEKTKGSSSVGSSEELDNSQTPISLSLRKGRWKLAYIFSELGAPFPANLNLCSLIHGAAARIEDDGIALLCRKGGRPSADAVLVLVESFTSMRRILGVGKSILCDSFKKSLRLLCSAGADINYYGVIEGLPISAKTKTTPLTLAMRLRGSREILQDFLIHGADLYFQSDKTFDPILTAALFGEKEDLSCLLAHCAAHPSPSHWTNYLDESSDERDPIERICFCLRKAGCLEKTNIEGQTLWHLASQEDNVALMTSLIIEGALGNAAHNGIESAPTEPGLYCSSVRVALDDANMLGLAVQKNDIQTASNLLQGGINPNQNIKGRNIPLLYHASSHGQSEIVSLLLSHGAATEVTNDHGWNPLHVACFHGHTQIARALISNGANVHASTLRWNHNIYVRPSGLFGNEAWTGTCLHIATVGGHPEIVKILLEHNVDVHASTSVTANKLSYPASGPSALHIALSINPGYGFDRKVLSPERLQIGEWLVDAGAMVQGVIQELALKDILCFEKFPRLWDSLVAGDAGADDMIKVSVTSSTSCETSIFKISLTQSTAFAQKFIRTLHRHGRRSKLISG